MFTSVVMDDFLCKVIMRSYVLSRIGAVKPTDFILLTKLLINLLILQFILFRYTSSSGCIIKALPDMAICSVESGRPQVS